MKILSVNIDPDQTKQIVRFSVVDTDQRQPRGFHGKMDNPSYAEVKSKVQKYIADHAIERVTVQMDWWGGGLYDMLQAQIRTVEVTGH